jgi:hypothetical protein
MLKPKLDPALRDAILALFAQARKALDSENRDEAVSFSTEAWARVPEPKFGWDVTYVFLSRMVRFFRNGAQIDEGIKLVNGYLGSGHHLEYEDGPYFWLGTLYFEKGDLQRAYDYFVRAEKMSGGRCFRDEESRYKQFFKTFKSNVTAQ